MWHTKRQESKGHLWEKLISKNCPQESPDTGLTQERL